MKGMVMTVPQSTLITPMSIPPTDEQIGQIRDLVGHAIRKVKMSQHAAQALVQDGAGFQKKLTPILRGYDRMLKQQRNPYFGECVKPNQNWSYDPATLPSTDLQATAATATFGLQAITPVLVEYTRVMPRRADGRIIVPSLTDLGRVLGIADPLGKGYGPMTEKLVNLLGAMQPQFNNRRRGMLTERHMRLHEQVRARWEQLEQQFPAKNPTDFRCFVLPVNSGSLYQGYSPRNARTDALLKSWLPLGPVEVAWMLAAWPKRLAVKTHTCIDCSGAEYSPDADGQFDYVLSFCVFEGALKFGLDWADAPSGSYGSAFVVLPEQ